MLGFRVDRDIIVAIWVAGLTTRCSHTVTVSQISALVTLPARLQPGTALFRGFSSPASETVRCPMHSGSYCCSPGPPPRQRCAPKYFKIQISRPFSDRGEASARHVLCLHITLVLLFGAWESAPLLHRPALNARRDGDRWIS
jgi:hypothetical protein